MAKRSLATGGLKHEVTGYGDHYTGSAEDLIAAGLVTADQFPGQPGRGKTMCTYYAGALVKKGAHHEHDEHYLSIRRYGRGKFEVIKGVPKELYLQRVDMWRAERERKEEEQHEQERRERVKNKTADDFRKWCLFDVRLLRSSLNGAHGEFLFQFSPDVTAEAEALLCELEDLMQSSEVLPLQPKSASAGRGHLRLAWSAS